MCTRAKAKPAENGTADQAEHLRTYRVGNIRQSVEFLLHLLQDVCGGAGLGFAVVELIQNSIENLPQQKGLGIQPDLRVINCWGHRRRVSMRTADVPAVECQLLHTPS